MVNPAPVRYRINEYTQAHSGLNGTTNYIRTTENGRCRNWWRRACQCLFFLRFNKFDNSPRCVPYTIVNIDHKFEYNTVKHANEMVRQLVAMRSDILHIAKQHGTRLDPLLNYLYTVAAFDVDPKQIEPVEIDSFLSVEDDNEAVVGRTPFYLAGIFEQYAGYKFAGATETRKFVRRANRILVETGLFVATSEQPEHFGRFATSGSSSSVSIQIVYKKDDGWGRVPLRCGVRVIPQHLHVVNNPNICSLP